MTVILVAFDYWRDVIIDASYLMVFYEKKPEFPYKWETRHKDYRKNFISIYRINFQVIPYYACDAACILLYFIHTDKKDVWEMIWGSATIVVSFLIFIIWGRIRYETYMSAWEKCKEEENGKREAFRKEVFQGIIVEAQEQMKITGKNPFDL